MTSVTKRKSYKDVDIGGRKWRIGRFDALTGSYIATMLMMQVLPLGVSDQLGLPGMASEGSSMMKKEVFFELQRDCLRVCSELKDVGGTVAPMLVMLPDGRWGVDGVENNIPLVIGLTIQALIFNFSDFFQGGAMDELKRSFSDLNPSDAPE